MARNMTQYCVDNLINLDLPDVYMADYVKTTAVCL